ncbi:hypothetical protein DPMN_073126 [Dreissena polymorpha]|uniref:Uncharacterized protein n=1 Tax=Dreissena polymorpha TaxID=45954 RepID=A0A9D4HAF9_DREPO|nr:hypothetical protein DPMN_073126 [Dreissena polymorpha]
MFFNKPQAINLTNLRTKFHEYWAINVTSRVLTSKAETIVLTKFHEDWTKNFTSTCFHYTHIERCAPPPSSHVFSPIWTIFELFRDINETNVLIKFHDDWANILTSRVFTRNTASPPGGHVFQWTETILTSTNLNEDWASNVNSTVFELGRGIIGTNVLTKFHEDQTINVASRVFTRQMLTTDARRTKGNHNCSP